MINNENDLIYFGEENVDLYTCTGIFRNYDIKRIHQEPRNEESSKLVIKSKEDLSYIDTKYAKYFIICIPETLIQLKCDIPDNETEKNIEILTHPLIKYELPLDIKENKTTSYKGIKSGHRSCILKDKSSNKFYRLKGCGNDLEGFPILKRGGVCEENTIRGCHFEVTAARELFYANKIGDALKKYNIPCGNIPVGYWKYGKELSILGADNIKQPQNVVPEVDKYCCIFDTLGERRLKSHLMEGLEQIIMSIVEFTLEKNKIENENMDFLNSLLDLFPGKRKIEGIRTEIVVPSNSPPFIQPRKPLPVVEWIKKPIYKDEDYSVLFPNKDLKEKLKTYDNLKMINDLSNQVSEWINYFIKDLSQPKSDLVRKISNHLINQINSQNKSKTILENLLDIFVRIGYECGKVQRAMKEEEINWGTFYERGFYLHCNAHGNNFVVLPQGYNYLLAPVDFDLSYTKEKFVCIVEESKNYGQYDESYFENYLGYEINELPRMITEIEEYKLANKKEKTYKDKISDCIKYLLYDSLIESYMKSFDKIEMDVPTNIEKNDVFHELVKIALIKTSEIIA